MPLAVRALLVAIAASFVVAVDGRAQALYSVVLCADVRVTTSTDETEAAVTLDEDGDGLVERAFRVQHLSPTKLKAAGAALVLYADDHLAIAFADGTWLNFVVSDTGSAVLGDAHRVSVMGLARFWGDSIHLSHEEAAATLISTTALTTMSACLSSAPCTDCENGGTGEKTCSLTTPYVCTVTCGSGSFACCTSSGGCRCCPE